MAFELAGSKAKVRPSINVTPLVDVVLVLLIIFMVITPLMTMQLSVNVPIKPDDAARNAPPEDEAQVVLTVDARGVAFINTQSVGDAELPGKLQRIFAVRRDHTL